MAELDPLHRDITGRQAYFLEVPGTSSAAALSVVSFEATEKMGAPTEVRIVLTHPLQLTRTEYLNRDAAFSIVPDDGPPRKFSGFIERFSTLQTTKDYVKYEVLLKSHFARLAAVTRCRIFQHASAPDIIAAVLRSHGLMDHQFLFRLRRKYPQHLFRMQYQMSDAAYQYVMWLLSLAVLLGLKEWVPKIATWISTDPEDGQDVLVSRLFGRLGVPLPGESLIHEKPYADMLRATETQGEDQQQAVVDYLKHWYSGMKGCYWHDRHKRLNAFFFGYWAFEAGLVTLLWNIDDSSYRDKRFYPKDLVDFAREQGMGAQGEAHKPHISQKTGERCSYAGRWGVLESPGAFVQERFFKQGDIFPAGIGRDRQEGPVTWIVMMREDGGPTREE